MSDTTAVFGKNLKRLRIEKEITQSQLAKKLNVGITTISNYETGRNEPSMEKLIVISKIFNVSIDRLIGNIQANNSKDKEVSEIDRNILIKLGSLSEDERIFIYNIINLIKNKNKIK